MTDILEVDCLTGMAKTRAMTTEELEQRDEDAAEFSKIERQRAVAEKAHKEALKAVRAKAKTDAAFAALARLQGIDFEE